MTMRGGREKTWAPTACSYQGTTMWMRDLRVLKMG